MARRNASGGRTAGEASFARVYRKAKPKAAYRSDYVSNAGPSKGHGNKVLASDLSRKQIVQAKAATTAARKDAVSRYIKGERMSTADQAVALRSMFRNKSASNARRAYKFDAEKVARRQQKYAQKRSTDIANSEGRQTLYSSDHNAVHDFLKELRKQTLKRFGVDVRLERKAARRINRKRPYENRYR